MCTYAQSEDTDHSSDPDKAGFYSDLENADFPIQTLMQSQKAISVFNTASMTSCSGSDFGCFYPTSCTGSLLQTMHYSSVNTWQCSFRSKQG
eukprot:2949757-Rhodomonas_salina.3